jgi:hypothetical protein
MIPNETQFENIHNTTMGHLDSAIKLTKGLADIFGNNAMSPSDKEAAIKALNESVAASPATTSTEHEYHAAMSQDPRYSSSEDLEGMGNDMFKAEQEKKNNG